MLVKGIIDKRKTTPGIPFEDVMSDINKWLDKDDDGNNETQVDLDELYDENEEIRDANNPMDQEVLEWNWTKKMMKRKILKDSRQGKVDIPTYRNSLLKKGLFMILAVVWIKKTSRI